MRSFFAALFLITTTAHATPAEDRALALSQQASRLPQGTAREIAQYELAVSLYEMNLPTAAFGIFSEIADRPQHARFDATLPWLAELEDPVELASLSARAALHRRDERAVAQDGSGARGVQTGGALSQDEATDGGGVDARISG